MQGFHIRNYYYDLAKYPPEQYIGPFGIYVDSIRVPSCLACEAWRASHHDVHIPDAYSSLLKFGSHRAALENTMAKIREFEKISSWYTGAAGRITELSARHCACFVGQCLCLCVLHMLHMYLECLPTGMGRAGRVGQRQGIGLGWVGGWGWGVWGVPKLTLSADLCPAGLSNDLAQGEDADGAVGNLGQAPCLQHVGEGGGGWGSSALPRV